jgi:hypothetical protein
MTKLNELAVPITSMEQVEEWKKTWDGKSAIPQSIFDFAVADFNKSCDDTMKFIDSIVSGDES